MTTSFDKQLAQKRKEEKAKKDQELDDLCHQWKVLFYNPKTYLYIGLVFAYIVILGFYQEWKIKLMLELFANHLFSAIITFFTTKKIQKLKH